MREGPEVLEELRQVAWVDPSVDYPSVITGLAYGVDAVFLLAKDRDQSSFTVQYRDNEAVLIEELTTIARTWVAGMPPPPEPRIDLSRLVRDFESITGRSLTLKLRWEQMPDEGGWFCDVVLDGRFDGAIGRLFGGDEEDLIAVAGSVGSFSFHEATWDSRPHVQKVGAGPWPICPRHPTNLIRAEVTPNGIASWVCRAHPDDSVPIGSLSEESWR